tara:strand:+ start:251 stop:445 length:195 start_codon:yes stop_codon:yes gene_type:complete
MKMKDKNWLVGKPIDDIGVAHVNFIQFNEHDEIELRPVCTITFTKEQWERFKLEINCWFDTNGT